MASHTACPPPPVVANGRGPDGGRFAILLKIESLVHELLHSLSEDITLRLPIPSRKSHIYQPIECPRTLTRSLAPNPNMIAQPEDTVPSSGYPALVTRSKAAFPAPALNTNGATRFVKLLTILAYMHGCVARGTRMTKRELFYQDPALFGSQRVVDRYVEDITATLNVHREELGIIAAAKGLVSGQMELWQRGPSDENLSSSDKENWRQLLCSTSGDIATLVPHIDGSVPMSRLRWELDSIYWVLVVEKEATFRHLIDQHLCGSSARPGLLVTAKGYPDLDTRAFLHRLAAAEPCIPVYILADWDPDGLGIVATYARGSAAMARRNAELRLTEAEWIGVTSKCAVPLLMKESGGTDSTLMMSARDRRVAKGLLAADVRGGVACVSRLAWVEDVRVMLMLNVKAEIQILERLPGGLVEWLKLRLRL